MEQSVAGVTGASARVGYGGLCPNSHYIRHVKLELNTEIANPCSCAHIGNGNVEFKLLSYH